MTTRCDNAAPDGTGTAITEFTATVAGLNPVVWGTLTDCLFDLSNPSGVPGMIVRSDGSFRLWLVDQQGFDPNVDQWLLAFEGATALEGQPALEGQIDFQWDYGIVTMRLPLTDGSWCFVSLTAGDANLVFNDTLGNLTCDLVQLRCTSDDNHPLDGISL